MIWRSFTLIGLGLTAGMLGVWLGDREPPTVSAKLEPVVLRVPPGGNLNVRYSVYRTRSCPLRVERLLIDSQNVRYVLPATEFSAAPGPLGEDSYISMVPLPQGISEGTAHYRAITIYKCNPLHSIWPIVVTAPDVEFYVVRD